MTLHLFYVGFAWKEFFLSLVEPSVAPKTGLPNVHVGAKLSEQVLLLCPNGKKENALESLFSCLFAFCHPHSKPQPYRWTR